MKIVKVISVIVFDIVMAIILLGACNGIHCNAQSLQGKTIVVNKEKAGKATGYSIQVDGKTYPILQGPRGGLYYMKGDKKVYLTKKQKELIK